MIYYVIGIIILSLIVLAERHIERVESKNKRY
jgi:hypothetical protein